jgi:F0F1-type ATP synthase alpha subunit
MARRPINAMDRDPVRTPLDTGVRAINALLTVGRGQRHRPVRRHRRGQVGAAGDDGALHAQPTSSWSG